MRSISSGFNASTSTGSYDLFGADISSRASDWLADGPRTDSWTVRQRFWDTASWFLGHKGAKGRV
jgi:hypothetical protein